MKTKDMHLKNVEKWWGEMRSDENEDINECVYLGLILNMQRDMDAKHL